MSNLESNEEFDLSDIEATIYTAEITNQKLQHLISGKEKPLLIAAAQRGKLATVKNLIARGVDVNFLDDDENLAVDYAWKNRFYNISLLLLEADSCFPKGFNWPQLSLCEKHVEKNFKRFVTDRSLLHKYIKEDNLEYVKNNVSKSKSKYYLNEKNVSATFVAFKYKRIDIQDHLKSIGAEFLNDSEKQKLKDLGIKMIDEIDSSNSSCSDDYQNDLAMETAWANKNYDVVLTYLKEDFRFPNEFNLDQLNDGDLSAQNLKGFVEERNYLHECIQNDNVENFENIVSKSKSKFYLNQKNQSASFTALKWKKLNIQAYLSAKGAEFLNAGEKKELEQLSYKDRFTLRVAKITHFPSVSEAHIDYLISKSRSQKTVEGARKKLTHFYWTLDQIPEISVILKVIQYSDFLDIVFDFDEKNVVKINPLSSKYTKGEAMFKERRVYIAASPKRGERKIMGTIAHELTHMAMELLFENECNPYPATDEKGDKFKKIKKETLRNVKKTSNDSPAGIILNVKTYTKQEQLSELIVTVPQILVEYEDGKKWLQENAFDLLNFYTEIIIPKCNEFIKASPVLKTKSNIRKFNESLGEIMKLRKLNLNFNNVDSIRNFLNRNNKTLFIFKTEYAHFGMVKVLQGIFGLNYISEFDKYLALNFENLMLELYEVMKAYLDGCDNLILQFNHDPNGEKLTEFFAMISEIFTLEPNKKIILIIHPNMKKNICETLQEFPIFDASTEEMDEALHLSCLDEKSRMMVLSKEIIFQGMKKRLQDLIGADKQFYDFINGNLIENLIKGSKDVCIGSRTSEHHYLENAFVHIYEKINIESFIRELEDLKSKDTFVIYGLSKKDDLVAYLYKYAEEGGLINTALIVGQIETINSKYFKITDKRILLTERFTDADIKKFCVHNRHKKIYFIEMKNKASFVLKLLYNPDFYFERKFKIFVINYKKLEVLTSKSEKKGSRLSGKMEFDLKKKEFFIISKNDKNFKDKIKYGNVVFSNLKKAERIFENFNENEKQARKHWFSDESDIEDARVHWFHKQNSDKIHWINSLGSIKGLRSRFLNSKIKNELFISENDLIDKLMYKKVVLIADNPGMGKTTTLSKLYESSLIAKTHWVIRIDLKEHANEIKNIDDSNFNIQNLIAFLLKIKPDLDNKLTEDLLQSVLTTETGFAKSLLAFDGFDEILDKECRENAIFLFKYIQKSTKSKIWITTRLQHKYQLENELSTFALEFDPIDDKNKEIFIKKFFRDRLKLVLNPEHVHDIFDGPDQVKNESKIWIYTSKFLEYMETIFHQDVSSFIGTPLQLNLMTENSTDHFKTWAENENKNLVDFSYLGKNVLEVYEQFIEKKYRIFFRKLKIKEELVQQREKELSKQYHKALAESLNRNKYFDSKWQDATPLMLLVGLIKSGGDTLNAQFIHFTIREYFFALVFTDLIMVDSNDSSTFNEKINYFINKILLLPEHQLVRNFINIQLEKSNMEKLPKNNMAMFGKVFCSSWRNEKPDELELCLKSETIFWKTIEERNENIFNFIIVSCEELMTDTLYFNLVTISEMKDRKTCFLHKAILNKNFKIFYLLYEKIETLSVQQQENIINIRNEDHGTILHLGVESGDLNIIQFLFDKLESMLSIRELQSFLMEKASDGNNVLQKAKAKGYMEIVNYIQEKGNTIFPSQDKRRFDAAILRRRSTFLNTSFRKYLRQSYE